MKRYELLALITPAVLRILPKPLYIIVVLRVAWQCCEGHWSPRAGTDAKLPITVGQSEGAELSEPATPGPANAPEQHCQDRTRNIRLYNNRFKYLEKIGEGFVNAADIVYRRPACCGKACDNHSHGGPVIAVTLHRCAG